MKITPEWEQTLDDLPQGIFFTYFLLAFVVLALFFASLYQQMDLALFTLIILVMAILLKSWSAFSPKSLRYRVFVDKQKVFPGEKIDFRVTIKNNKFLPVLVKIRLSLPQSLVTGIRDRLIKEQSGILWHQEISFHRELSPTQRGLYQTGSPRLITGDFFGFFPRKTRERQDVDVLVFPRFVPIKPFFILNRIMFGKKAHASPIHDPIHIIGTRDYRSFSSARNIHWKATARHHKLQEKIFEVTEQEKIIIILEADGFLDKANETAFERTIEVIASLSFEMDANNYAVGFLTNCYVNGNGQHFLWPVRKPGHISTLFEILAKIVFKSSRPMNDLLHKEAYPFSGSSCLYFSCEPMGKSLPLSSVKSPLINIISKGKSFDSISMGSAEITRRSCYLEDICEAA
jgi:Protein of unknown function DUF58